MLIVGDLLASTTKRLSNYLFKLLLFAQQCA